MINIQLFNVAPAFPAKLRFLEELAGNLWWSWHNDAIELFRRINPHMWREAGHNPLIFLSRLPQKRLETLAGDDAFLRHMNDVEKRFRADVNGNEKTCECSSDDGCIAYFSLEYGIHESIRLYSGGLGVLAGDHLKAASDDKLPLVAIGLMYRQGYFQQYLNQDGWQQEHYPENQLYNLPMHPVTGSDGLPMHISLPLPGGNLQAMIWRLDVGRVPLFLLDANIPENPPEWRIINAQLYGGDRTIRLRQELLLGIGGFRALQAMQMNPQVFHMNEGHATFLSLARISHFMQNGISLEAATEIVSRTNCFTTHTPVPAGNEMFHVDLLRPHLEALHNEINIDPKEVIKWGQPPNIEKDHHEISMTVLGLRWAAFNNGVSRLHGKVARKMWGQLWPGRPEDELPIDYITNGVHVQSWMSEDNAALCNRYLGADWARRTETDDAKRGIELIPDEELWRAHELGRSRLIRSCREMMEKQYRARNATRAELTQAKGVLEHDILTIGFARRFATYKRATLLLKDIERFEALLTNEDRPVQFIFAGKAHPADEHGKDLIRQLVQFSKRPAVRRRIIFLENYDMNIARRMVQGIDVWLNVPRRPQEASGTSGMKAAINGGLNVSVLDGWWDEGCTKDTGWAIGAGEEYDDPEYGDVVESQALYNILENEVIPCFYERTAGDMPQQWIHMMKASIKMGLSFFTSHRMVGEYYTKFYQPARENYRRLTENDCAEAGKLVKLRQRLRENWKEIHISRPHADRETTQFHVGDEFTVSVEVNLGKLKPEEVEVQVYYGPVDSYNQIITSHRVAMELAEKKDDSAYLYSRSIACERTGRYGFTVRVVPSGNDWNAVTPGFMTWTDGAA